MYGLLKSDFKYTKNKRIVYQPLTVVLLTCTICSPFG